MLRSVLTASLVVTYGPRLQAAPHPEPRVIVTVPSVAGPHDRARVERAAREAWGAIIRCYKTHAGGRRGEVGLEMTVSATGKVTGSHPTRTTFSNRPLERCLAASMNDREMPAADGTSVASVNIRLAPGDPPG